MLQPDHKSKVIHASSSPPMRLLLLFFLSLLCCPSTCGTLSLVGWPRSSLSWLSWVSSLCVSHRLTGSRLLVSSHATSNLFLVFSCLPHAFALIRILATALRALAKTRKLCCALVFEGLPLKLIAGDWEEVWVLCDCRSCSGDLMPSCL